MGSYNSEPESRGLYRWASNLLSKSMLKVDRILLLCNAVYCFRLYDNTGLLSLLVGLLMSYFMIVTRHEVLDFCWRSNLPLSVFKICWSLPRACS